MPSLSKMFTSSPSPEHKRQLKSSEVIGSPKTVNRPVVGSSLTRKRRKFREVPNPEFRAGIEPPAVSRSGGGYVSVSVNRSMSANPEMAAIQRWKLCTIWLRLVTCAPEAKRPNPWRRTAHDTVRSPTKSPSWRDGFNPEPCSI